VTVLESEQHGKLGALVHDKAVAPDSELLQSVAAAAQLALERNLLQTELRARVDELERVGWVATAPTWLSSGHRLRLAMSTATRTC
jgi:hypothetical protein